MIIGATGSMIIGIIIMLVGGINVLVLGIIAVTKGSKIGIGGIFLGSLFVLALVLEGIGL